MPAKFIVATAPAPGPVPATRRLCLRPRATALLIAGNSLVFLAMAAVSGHPLAPPRPQLLAWGACAGLAGAGQPWRLLTATFLHLGLLHLALNMLTLWNIGQVLEPRVGRARFLLVYTLAGILGSLASLLCHPDRTTVGASGSILGMFGLLLAFLAEPRNRLTAPLRRQLRDMAFSFLALNLALGLALPGMDGAAHAGGLVAGYSLGWLLIPPRPTRSGPGR